MAKRPPQTDELSPSKVESGHGQLFREVMLLRYRELTARRIGDAAVVVRAEVGRGGQLSLKLASRSPSPVPRRRSPY